MKRLAYILISTLITVNFTACSGSKPENQSSQDIGGTTSLEIPVNSQENSSEIPENSVPEIPKGEPTFLTAPDGTPIFTSEITEIGTVNEFTGENEPLTLEQAEQYARSCEGEFIVKCDGFAYVYIPQKALNRTDDPEMFKESGGGWFEFTGDEEKTSSDYIRISVGDKFGSLTVKNAYTMFRDNRFLESFSEIPGAYIDSGAVEFDGTVELTGYVNVWEDSDYQGAGGTMVFYPDGESSVKIPVISYSLSDGDMIVHRSEPNSSGYFGDWWCFLGNMSVVNCDTSGLHKGDVFVKVKITADNVTSDIGGVRLKLKSLEVL